MVSISERFVKQLKEIISRLGFRVTYEKRDSLIRHRFTIHKLSIRGNEMTQKWFCEIKPNNPKHINKFKKLNL